RLRSHGTLRVRSRNDATLASARVRQAGPHRSRDAREERTRGVRGLPPLVPAHPVSLRLGLRAVADEQRKAARSASEEMFDLAAMPTISIGIGELMLGDDAAAWLKRADEGLYAAKAAGRDATAQVQTRGYR